MEQKERDDEIPAAEAQSAHPMEPAEGAREPGVDLVNLIERSLQQREAWRRSDSMASS